MVAGISTSDSTKHRELQGSRFRLPCCVLLEQTLIREREHFSHRRQSLACARTLRADAEPEAQLAGGAERGAGVVV